MLTKTLTKLVEVMDEEYAMASQQHGGVFASPHEGYAVILEEIEEAEEALNRIKPCSDMLWDRVKNDTEMDSDVLAYMKGHALQGAGELIQVAAMIEKYRYSQEVWKEIENECK